MFKRGLLTSIVITTRVTFIVPESKNAALSEMLTPPAGLHSPTFTRECCFNFNRSSLNWIRRPSLNSMGPLKPFNSTCNNITQHTFVSDINFNYERNFLLCNNRKNLFFYNNNCCIKTINIYIQYLQR